MSRKRSVDELNAPNSVKSVIAWELYSQLNSLFFCLFLSLPQALQLDEGRKLLLVDLAAVSLLLSSLSLFRHLDFQTCFPLCLDH